VGVTDGSYRRNALRLDRVVELLLALGGKEPRLASLRGNPLAWATIVIGASLLTPLGYFGFLLVPVWLVVVGLWLSRGKASPEPIRS
jgi:hypothetical protein